MNTELNKAVCAVMAEVHSLKKAEKNDHGKYNYVSVDAFKDFVRPLMAKNGLSLLTNEVDFALDTVQSRNGATVVARITFEFTLHHISGEIAPPERATIVLPYTGAQTAGAAKSYVIKEYMKGKFLVSTGDKDLIEGGADADAYKQQEYTTEADSSIDATEFCTIRELIVKTKTEEKKLLDYVKATSLENMTKAQFRVAETALRKKLSTPKAEAA